MVVQNRVTPGTILGRFQLLLEIGAGGMGSVWAARRLGNIELDRLFAIKVAHTGEGAPGDAERLFLDEARIRALLRHPHASALHELGEHEGLLYFAMDWSDGASLRELVDAGPLDPAIAARIVANACAGLQAAHELTDEEGQWLALVHRDVSPDNILISANGHVRITDFGVAKARGQLHARTATGELRGKASYLAPEQVTSGRVDARADIFALGCVLYEATVGEPAFSGEHGLATLYSIVEREAPSPSSRVAGYPDELERIVERALRKKPKERFQTAAEMQLALERWLASAAYPITELDVARALEAALGDRIRARNQRVRSAAAQYREDEDAAGQTSELGLQDDATSDLEPRPPPTDTTGLNAAVPSTRRAKRSRPWLAAGLALTLAGATAFGIAATRSPSTGVEPAASGVEAQGGVVTSALPVEAEPARRAPSAAPTAVLNEPPGALASVREPAPERTRAPRPQSSAGAAATDPGPRFELLTPTFPGGLGRQAIDERNPFDE